MTNAPFRKELRVYVDTSVVSGMFDHSEQTEPFCGAVIDDKIKIIVSDTLEQEVDAALEHVQKFFADLSLAQKRVTATDESDDLANAYSAAKVISENHLDDCKHIASASVHRADYLVS